MGKPIILFVGMPDSGKTMATYSLAEYLDGKGWKIEPDRTFDRYNEAYQTKCNEFQNKLDMNRPRRRTNQQRIAMDKTRDVFMKLDVKNSGGQVEYHILEMPGEKFFDPANPANPLGTEIKNILISDGHDRCKIIFVLLLDLYTRKWDDVNKRNGDPAFTQFYNRVMDILGYFKDGDKVIALLNQIDKSSNSKADWKTWEQAYSPIFNDLSKKKKLIIFDKIKVAKLPYSSGRGFHEEMDKETNKGTGVILYNHTTTVDKYAGDLWKEITKKFSWI